MVAKKGWMKKTCLSLVISGLLFSLVQNSFAETNCPLQKSEASNEQTACSQTLLPCPRSIEPYPACAKTGSGPITGFLAFGCRLNYRLTNWILSDKCDQGSIPADCPTACSHK